MYNSFINFKWRKFYVTYGKVGCYLSVWFTGNNLWESLNFKKTTNWLNYLFTNSVTEHFSCKINSFSFIKVLLNNVYLLSMSPDMQLWHVYGWYWCILAHSVLCSKAPKNCPPNLQVSLSYIPTRRFPKPGHLIKFSIIISRLLIWYFRAKNNDYVFPDIHLFGISEQNMFGISEQMKNCEHSNLASTQI